MVVIKINGGLGNQMFQYALYLSFLEKGFEAKIDISQLGTYKLHNGYELERIFITQPNLAEYNEVKRLSRNRINNIFSKFYHCLPRKKTEIIEKEFHSFKPEIFNFSGNIYLDGYWQNEEYFSSSRNSILNHFKFKLPFDPKNEKLSRKIENGNYVSIHVRRGDYLLDAKRLGFCNIDYYKKAISQINSLTTDPKYVIFSDDINWCKENLPGKNNIYVDWNKDKSSYRDMQLMSMCQHNIIANSSFSWWGAWLNRNLDKIVIAPKFWIGEIKSEKMVTNNSNWKFL